MDSWKKGERNSKMHSMKIQENKKNTLSAFVRTKKKSHSDINTTKIHANFFQYHKSSALPIQTRRMNQNDILQLCPSVHERTKSATVRDRHNIPHPFIDLGDWYKTLMTERIANLFLTQDGFLGHAQQINQELSRLEEAFPFFEPAAIPAVNEYITRIKSFIIERAKSASFNIPFFIFHFPEYKTLSIEKKNGTLKKNGHI